jgi:O-methyltransferase involved in polyketide biosynthesis
MPFPEVPLTGRKVMPVPGRGPKFDVSVPNAARIYDYLLGGKDNYQADRDAAERLLKLLPDVQDACRQNRYFLQRVVSYLVGQCGIRQIIDIGSGLPTRDNVHQVARRNHPGTRVVYVDYDPVVVSHANSVLAGGGVTPGVAVVHADVREPKALLGHPKVTELIDFGSPVAVLMLAVLHFIPDEEDPRGIVEAFADVIAPDSYLAISHMTDDDVGKLLSVEAQGVYIDASAPAVPRSAREIGELFAALELVPPGLADVNQWPGFILPDVAPMNARTLMYGALGRKVY